MTTMYGLDSEKYLDEARERLAFTRTYGMPIEDR